MPLAQIKENEMKKVLIVLALLFQISCENVENIENSSSYIFAWT